MKVITENPNRVYEFDHNARSMAKAGNIAGHSEEYYLKSDGIVVRFDKRHSFESIEGWDDESEIETKFNVKDATFVIVKHLVYDQGFTTSEETLYSLESLSPEEIKEREERRERKERKYKKNNEKYAESLRRTLNEEMRRSYVYYIYYRRNFDLDTIAYISMHYRDNLDLKFVKNYLNDRDYKYKLEVDYPEFRDLSVEECRALPPKIRESLKHDACKNCEHRCFDEF